MSTDFPRLRKLFLTSLAESSFMKTNGFIRKQKSFRQTTEYGSNIVDICFYAMPGYSFHVDIDLMVRHDAVQNIIASHCPTMPQDIIDFSYTIGNNVIGIIRQTPYWSWEIRCEKDSNLAVDDIQEKLTRLALPYFQRFASLTEILNVLTDNDVESTRLNLLNQSFTSLATALVIAFLIGDKENFDAVAPRYTHALSEWIADLSPREHQQSNYTGLLEDLQERWPKEAGYLADASYNHGQKVPWPPDVIRPINKEPDVRTPGEIADLLKQRAFAASVEPPWVGGAVYFSLPDEHLRTFIQRVLVNTSGCLGGKQMLYKQSISSLTERYGRIGEVTIDTLKRLASSLTNGQADSVILYDRSPDQDSDSSNNHIEWRIDPYPFEDQSDMRRISFLMPRVDFDEDAVISFLKTLVIDYPAYYGCIAVGALDSAKSVAQLKPMISKSTPLPGTRKDYSSQIQSMLKEIAFYRAHAVMLNNKIPRAEWGLILSREHTDQLGGTAKINKKSGCCLVETWGGNTYLKLTKSLYDISKQKLEELNKYLSPIRFPDAPHPIYWL